LLVEVQSLLDSDAAGLRPRAQGLESSRVALLIAVLSARGDVIVGPRSLFVAAVGGITINEPAADLAVILSVASAVAERALPHDMVVFGEVGLAGELRTVPGAERRLAEAQRAGFTRAIVPASTPVDAVPRGMHVDRCRKILDALAAADEGSTGTMPAWLTGTASR
jgi:DNA repair protein RadA/Sms